MNSEPLKVQLCICSEGEHTASYSGYGGRPALRFRQGMLGVVVSKQTRDGQSILNVYYFDPASHALERVFLPTAAARLQSAGISGRFFCGVPDAEMQAALLPEMARHAPGHFAELRLEALTIAHVGSLERPRELPQGAPAAEWLQNVRRAVGHYINAAKWEQGLCIASA